MNINVFKAPDPHDVSRAMEIVENGEDTKDWLWAATILAEEVKYLWGEMEFM